MRLLCSNVCPETLIFFLFPGFFIEAFHTCLKESHEFFRSTLKNMGNVWKIPGEVWKKDNSLEKKEKNLGRREESPIKKEKKSW